MSHYSSNQYRPSEEYERFYYHLFFTKGDKIVDIGCSTGNFIAQDPQHIVGMDADKDAIALAKKRRFNARLHDVNKPFPFQSNSQQNAHCKHVLEHLDDPLPFMKEANRILKKGGRLILITDKMTPEFWDDYTHKRPYSKISLLQLAHDSGFEKAKVEKFPPQGVPGLGLLFKKGIISGKTARKIYTWYARHIKGSSLILEAWK